MIFFLKYDARHCMASVYSAVLQQSAQTVTFIVVANRREQVITASDVLACPVISRLAAQPPLEMGWSAPLRVEDGLPHAGS